MLYSSCAQKAHRCAGKDSQADRKGTGIVAGELHRLRALTGGKSMKMLVLLSVLGPALLIPGFPKAFGAEPTAAPNPPNPPSQGQGGAEAGRRLIVTCVTCGSGYPYLLARSSFGGPVHWVWEFDTQCRAPMAWRPDYESQLCGTAPTYNKQ
jgi:hypothetical protein